jgi:glycine/D-amino acid oxidase-like deaminating enzyme/nitrite reductase/ring-hydroxylating ferredoxin subunit
MDVSELEKELDAARRAGVRGVEMVERAPLPAFDTGPAIRYPGLAQFHPLKYLHGLIDGIEKGGGKIFANTRAESIEDGSPAKVVTTRNAIIECDAVVVATNTPVNDRYKIHTKQFPYRTYVVGLRLSPGAVPKGLYWDVAQDAGSAKEGHMASYHYVRLQKDPAGEVLVVGGEDHKTGHDSESRGDERWENLEAWARKRFAGCREVAYRWSGQVMEPADGVAFIGRNPGEHNVYVATGDSGHGMTHGTIAGMLITDLIQGRENAWARVYDPSRKVTGGLGIFAKENLKVGLHYGEFLTGGDVKSAAEIPLDSGVVIRDGLTKKAVYKDAEGRLHELSAVCPHLKCVVHWNPTEKSWDCPCHGSRFTKFGEVINGPALSGLEPFSKGQDKRKAA